MNKATPRLPHFMVLPAMGCPAECRYCFHRDTAEVIDEQRLEALLEYIATLVASTSLRHKLRLTLHGGEPLLAGMARLEQAFTGLRERLPGRRIQWNLQSNLWLLDERMARLLARHSVAVGTSLDGPENLTNLQRGSGYFARTWAGLKMARSHGLSSDCIATITPVGASQWPAILDFFQMHGLHPSIHPSIPAIGASPNEWTLSPAAFAELLPALFESYQNRRRHMRIAFLDQLLQSLVSGQGQVCTFRDCRGQFLAFTPDGSIFPCQRLAGHSEWSLGRVEQRLTVDELWQSPVGRRWQERQGEADLNCRECRYHRHCRGGCPYNAIAAGTAVDPYCIAYKRIFSWLEARLQEEMATPANIVAMTARPWDGEGHPLLRVGWLSELSRPERHPAALTTHARSVLAAVTLAEGKPLTEQVVRLQTLGRFPDQITAQALLDRTASTIAAPPGLNNCYLYLTHRCQMKCSHCYLYEMPFQEREQEMPRSDIVDLLTQAKAAGFRQAILLGGEPLLHRDGQVLWRELAQLRDRLAPLKLVLRSNFMTSLNRADLETLARACDLIVVSIDGDEASHDARRGPGSYQRTVRNLRAYAALAGELSDVAEISLAAVLSAAAVVGAPGTAVRRLARELGISRLRFRPVIPLGRAATWEQPPIHEGLHAHLSPNEQLALGFIPQTSCGLGRNLYVAPTGDCFPCYVLKRPADFLGNVLQTGLDAILSAPAFQDLVRQNVDTTHACRDCDVRYICGGICRLWQGRCETARQTARALHQAALDHLQSLPLSPVELHPE